MPVILDRMPFWDKADEITVHGERIRIRPNQIIVWVSLSSWRQKEPHPATRPFPAILDTGHTGSFSIQEGHLARWAGLRPEMLPIVGHVRERESRLSLHEANLWVHPNRRGSRRQIIEGAPYQLGLSHGIAIYPGNDNFPRLPLLGLRAIAANKLVLKIRGHRRDATLRTRNWWWPFD